MKLTDRQKEICKYLVLGMSNLEIANKMFLSVHTVKMHVSTILAQFGAKNRTQAAYILGHENIMNL